MRVFTTPQSDLFVLRRLIRCLLGGLVLINCHCATQSQLSEKAAVDRPADTTKGSEGGQLWYLQSEPNTYFPKGIDSKIETDSRSGEWVYTKEGDFFIPHAQLPSEQRRVLLADALDRGLDRQRIRSAYKHAGAEAKSEETSSATLRKESDSKLTPWHLITLPVDIPLNVAYFLMLWDETYEPALSIRNAFQTWEPREGGTDSRS